MEDKNPEIFLEEDDLKFDDINKVTCEELELNDITNKNNDYLLVGAYGNGAALLKTIYFSEMKTQKGAFKVKFFEKEKEIGKRKVMFAELYQIELLSKQYLIILTKKNLSLECSKYLTDFLTNKEIKFNQILILDSINGKNFIPIKQQDEIFYMKNRVSKYNNPTLKKFTSPNKLVGVSGYILTWADYKDIDCVVLISVFTETDIGVESVMIFREIVECYEFMKGRVEEKKIRSMGSISMIYNEYNSNKNNYFI